MSNNSAYHSLARRPRCVPLPSQPSNAEIREQVEKLRHLIAKDVHRLDRRVALIYENALRWCTELTTWPKPLDEVQPMADAIRRDLGIANHEESVAQRKSVRQLAVEIADRLFTDGSGVVASRLVAELDDGRSGGGWCHEAVVDQIATVLLANLQPVGRTPG